MPSSSGRWPRDVFAEAVWSSDLTPPQRLVALAYADHARDGDTAWIKWDRLKTRTGLGRSTAARALAELVDRGWLVEVEAARQHYSARYLLTPQQSQSGTPEQSQSGTPDEASSPALATSSPALATSSPGAGPDQRSHLQPDQPGPAREEDPVLVDNEDPRSNAAPYGRSDWSPAWCAEAIERAVSAGLCTAAEAPVLLQALANDPATTSPRRLTAPGGVKHAHALLGRGRSPDSQGKRSKRPPWCGACQKATRRLEAPDTGADLGKCPRCHPDSRRTAA